MVRTTEQLEQAIARRAQNSKAARSAAVHDAARRTKSLAAYAEKVTRDAEVKTRMAPSIRIVIFTEAFGPQVGGYEIRRFGVPCFHEVR